MSRCKKMTEVYVCKELIEYEMALLGIIHSLETTKPEIIKLRDITGDMTQDDEYYKDVETQIYFGDTLMYDVLINFSNKKDEWFTLNDTSILAIQIRYNEYLEDHYKYVETTDERLEVWERKKPD